MIFFVSLFFRLKFVGYLHISEMRLYDKRFLLNQVFWFVKDLWSERYMHWFAISCHARVSTSIIYRPNWKALTTWVLQKRDDYYITLMLSVQHCCNFSVLLALLQFLWSPIKSSFEKLRKIQDSLKIYKQTQMKQKH